MKNPIVLMTLLGFLVGATLSQYLNHKALAAADDQVNAALTAVAHAHAEIETLEGCHSRGAVSGIWAARQGDIHHD
jgi:hypothetical protein